MVSYLSYPDFWDNPHPPLASSYSVSLVEQKFDFRRYDNRKNRPILHRKETFIPPSHPDFAKFSKLTADEESLGLYKDPELIGHQEGWLKVLQSKEIKIAGHSIVDLKN
ncbi:MAG: hypothetical protein EBY21_06685 [Alphaproteobacteria bacterium]|nr:hypothetical protein [Alphaproteobacteria bacterium]